MNTTTNGNSDGQIEVGEGFLQGSHLYQEFLAEREEILRHKWIESEKAGHDIGFEKALLDWIVMFRGGWRRAARNHKCSCNENQLSAIAA